MRRKLSQILKLYTQPHLLCLLLLGIASGIPFILVSSTLTIWLVQAGYSNSDIGWMFLCTLPYGLKFLWAPLIDRYPIPFLCKKFGQRRGWAFFAQIFLILAVLGLSLTDPAHNVYMTAGCAFLLSFCSATQDIVLDAYRIDKVSANELPVGTALMGIGFRMGMLVSSAGTLWISSRFGWGVAYSVMAVLSFIGPIAVYCAKEPAQSSLKHGYTQALPSLSLHLRSVHSAFVDFIQRPQWMLIILFIFFYKISDAIPNAMSGPLLLDLDFTTDEIAYVGRTFGILMMILGGFLGGIVVSFLTPGLGAMVCGSIQLLSPLAFIPLIWMGHDMSTFMFSIAVQQLCCGMGHTAFVTYLSSLCTKTNYVGWTTFFLLVTLSGAPFLYILIRLRENSYGLIRQTNA
jgi:MFS family permease